LHLQLKFNGTVSHYRYILGYAIANTVYSGKTASARGMILLLRTTGLLFDHGKQPDRSQSVLLFNTKLTTAVLIIIQTLSMM